MSKLTIITASFPHGPGEPFLADEVPVLSGHFDSVRILHRARVESGSRELPAGVRSEPLAVRSGDRRGLRHLRHWPPGELAREFREVLRRPSVISAFRSFVRWADDSAREAIALLGSLREQNEVAYAYWLDQSAVALSLVKVWRPEVRAIARGHGWDVDESRHPGSYLPFRRFICRALDGVFPISQDGRRLLLQRAPDQAAKIRVSHLGVSAGELSPRPPRRSRLELLSCSNVVELKRLDRIIDALELLEGEPAAWTHIGDGPLLSQLREQARRAVAKTRDLEVNFLGAVARDDVRSLLNGGRVDLLLNASSSEGIPVSMMEAMASGIPCVGPDVGGVSEIIRSGFNGYLLSRHARPAEIRDAIRHFRESEEETRERLARAAVRTWRRRFNAQANYGEFAALIAPRDRAADRLPRPKA